MSDSINTDIEALFRLRDALNQFKNNILPLKRKLIDYLNYTDEEINSNYKRKIEVISEKRRRQEEECRTDSFTCDKCGARIYLKVFGDTTYCREVGCTGTLHRVYNNSDYERTTQIRDEIKLEEIRTAIKNYNLQKEKILYLFAAFFSSEEENSERGLSNLSKCISALESYLKIDLTIKSDSAKALAPSAVNSYQRANNPEVEIRLPSNISNNITAKLPNKRIAAVNTAYSRSPKYIIDAVNKCSLKLSDIRDTEYITDQNGNYILNLFGKRVKEACHYSPVTKSIAIHNDISNQEYADILQHEMGHFIDNILGSVSSDSRFISAFNNTSKQFSSTTAEGELTLNNMLDDAFSTGAAFDRNITDIISALTNNDSIVLTRFNDENIAYYRHDSSYWTRKTYDGQNAGMREKETFANIFAIFSGSYRISQNFIERWFPQLCFSFEQLIKGT